MAHGNWSDIMALLLFVAGVISLGWPRMLSQQLVPPILPMFDVKVWDPNLELIVRVSGALKIIIACMLSTVRWNDVNGKLSGIAFLFTAGVMTYLQYEYDKQKFLLRPLYLVALLCVISFLHLIRRPCDCETCLKEAQKPQKKAN